MIKRLFIFAVVIAFVITGLFFVLNSPFLVQQILTSTIKKNLKGYTLEKLSIGRQKFYGRDRLVLSNIQCRLKSPTEFYEILIRRVECTQLRGPIQVHIDRI